MGYQRIVSLLSRHHKVIVVVVPIAVFLIAGLLLLPLFRYQINPDATSYISIANKYADGDIKNAINGYWGPALSWIMAPFLRLGVDDALLLARLLALAACTIIILLLNRLFVFFKVPPGFRWFLFTPAIPVLLSWSLVQPITGDLLFAAACCFLALRGVRYLQKQNRANAMLLGLSCAFLYAAKPLGFYFAVVSLIFLALCPWRGTHTRLSLSKASKQLVLPLVVFLVVSAPWIVALSLKYGEPTIATGTRRNHALVGPDYANVDTTTLEQIIPPPNASAVNYREDPSDDPISDWNMFASFGNFAYGLGLIAKNMFAALEVFNRVSPIGGGIAIGLVFYYLVRLLRRGIRFGSQDYILLLVLLTIGAYLPILVLERYIFATVLLSMLLAVVVVANSPIRRKISRTMAASLFLVILSSTLYPAISQMNLHKQGGKNEYIATQALLPHFQRGDRLVSNHLTSLYICHHARIQCFGILPGSVADNDAALATLQAHHIEYYLYFGSKKDLPTYLYSAEYITDAGSTIPNAHLLRIAY